MLWPFKQFRKTPSPRRGTIDAIYGMIVAQAREPRFYEAFGVPDTVEGRFDMIVLHLWLVMRRLRGDDQQEALGQRLVERFCSDMDDNLRELGVGDLTVPKRMLKFGEALYGRAAAYDAALAQSGGAALAEALDRNIYNGQGLADGQGGPHALAGYVRTEAVRLDAVDAVALMSDQWRFASPSDARETAHGAP